MICEIEVEVPGAGLHDITHRITEAVSQADITEGLCTLFIQHTSASLLIQENYDPSARADLERWLNRLVPEGDDIYTHTLEGPDDMPAHIKSALTATSVAVPVLDRKLALGNWQGIFIWEHRHRPHRRRVIIHLN